MGLFSCGGNRKPQKPPRPMITRPIEGKLPSIQDKFHVNPNRTHRSLQQRRHQREDRADERRRARERERSPPRQLRVVNTTPISEQPTPPQMTYQGGGSIAMNDGPYPIIRQVARSERYGPRGRDERYVRTETPLLDDRFQGAYDQLSSKSSTSKSSRSPSEESVNTTRDPWSADAGLSRPEQRRAAPHVQTNHPACLSPGHAPQEPIYDSDGIQHFARFGNVVQTEDLGMESSSILRNHKFTPAPKDGKRILYNESDASATRRNMGF